MANIYIAVGSVTGTATAVAQAVGHYFTEQGHVAQVDEHASINSLTGTNWDGILVVTATTGQGDIPTNLLPFYADLGEQFPLQNQRPFGVISLGDSSYDRTFCRAGELMEERFYEIQGSAPIPRITIDATETVTPDVDALYWAKEWLAKVTCN